MLWKSLSQKLLELYVKTDFKVNIRSKLYISAGISIISVLILLWVHVVTSARITEQNKRHQLLDTVARDISELDLVTYDYLLHREKRMEQQWYLKYDSLGENLDKIEEEDLILVQALYATLRDLFSVVIAKKGGTQKLIEEGVSQEKIGTATALEARLVAQLLITSHSIINKASRLAEKAGAEVAKAQRLATNLTVMLMMIVVITVAISSLLVCRSISKPLDELTKGAEIIGKGDLEYSVGIKSKDEIGQLAAAFNKMTDNLKKVTASRDDLNREIAIRRQAEEEIVRSNAALAATNEELEAFSYSISHDLRTPLRGMDGFSQALLEDYADKLDATGKDYLRRVSAAAQRMAQLIDDMLDLSRVTRREIRREAVNLSATAQSIASELQKAGPERQVKFAIAEGVVANGDSHLLRTALENLLSNAWKFTANHPRATIEFGATQHNGKSAYFVRDNGAGFDMAYAGKLFGAFQRLHGRTEFPGTGIGLATVQRIIHRHGGRVWAEGAVEQGATFYFTL